MSTIRDVAAAAHVHPSTVSRVFSGKARISEETRQRVFSAAEQLGFQQPNAIARSLSIQRTNTLGIIVPHVFDGYFEDSFFPQIMRGLLHAAYNNQFRILVGGSNSHQDEITQALEMLGSHQVDGFIVLSSHLDVDEAMVTALQEQDAPFVFIGQLPDDCSHGNLLWVDADHEQATAQAIEYLLHLGHRRIAYVGGDPEMLVTKQRLIGYQQSLQKAGISLDERLIDYAYFAEDGGYQSVYRMRHLGQEAPTAFYAANDLMAIGVLRALRELDIPVPEQVSVMGTNGSPESGHVVPTLTTLYVPYAEMAKHAAEILIQLIANDTVAPSQRLVACEIISRDSTAQVSKQLVVYP
ncbi:MAG: LacI family DNA-binding transcriptional regulator [Chloroflexi bacterium]|nr:LacI family DNA-binding transcriptional regulator [Chloroflexota bacterium]MBP8055307.1 LacI family DNA-binding transcriptional regulator [Chloroflexota bacterium]